MIKSWGTVLWQVWVLDEGRTRRQGDWDTFMQAQFDRSAQVDADTDAAMKQLADEYAELEQKLESQVVTST